MDKFNLLLDHHNIPYSSVSISIILQNWIASLEQMALANNINDIYLRAYGGWWKEGTATQERNSAAQFYADNCPAFLKSNELYYRIHFEFADYLTCDVDKRIKIINTFVLRPAPQLFVELGDKKICNESDCEVKKIRAWLMKRRGCTRADCPHKFGDIWYKPEQKQVDIHLAMDLINLSNKDSVTAVASDDIDFIPAILSACFEKRINIFILRFQNKTTYLDELIKSNGINIVNIL